MNIWVSFAYYGAKDLDAIFVMSQVLFATFAVSDPPCLTSDDLIPLLVSVLKHHKTSLKDCFKKLMVLRKEYN